VGKMKQFASWFTHGVPGGGALRKQIFEAKKGDAVLDAVERFFAGREEAATGEVGGGAIEDSPELAAAGAYCD